MEVYGNSEGKMQREKSGRLSLQSQSVRGRKKRNLPRKQKSWLEREEENGEHHAIPRFPENKP